MTRPVVDVLALPLASEEELDRVLKVKKKINHHGRERRAQQRLDEQGAPCACSVGLKAERRRCLAHEALGYNRWLRPGA